MFRQPSVLIETIDYNACTSTFIFHLFNNPVRSCKTVSESKVFCHVSWLLLVQLQKVQNFVAWAATGARKFDCITPMLKQLQWLPVAWQLVVIDAVMSFKCLHGLATAYLHSKFIVLDTETSWMYRCSDQLPVYNNYCYRITGLSTPPHHQILKIDGEEIIDDIIMHGTWRHLWKKKCAKKMLLEL